MFSNYSNIPAIVEVARAEGVQVIHTYRKVQDPQKAALAFSACLAVDKGWANTMVPIRGGWRVVCDEDQRAVDFLRR
jgi:hypothetical protein